MERESNTDCDCSADIEPQIMEYWPNSNPENSASIRGKSTILSLTEHYLLTRATNVWDGPKYATYRRKETRLRSFVIHAWPLGLDPAPSVLSDAGFFYTGRTYILF